jgi:putative hydrolase of the HAD superfamily
LSYKFIYFDLDDTLLNHRAAEKSGLQEVHQQFSIFKNVDPQTLNGVYHQVNTKQWGLYSQGKVSREELQRNRFEQTLEQLGLDGSFYERVGNYYMQCYRNHWQWIQGAQEAYQRVIKQYPVGILTNGFAETQRKKFEEFDFYDSADHVVISEDVGVLKPDPKVFEYATDLANEDPSDILYIGDSFTSDIKGGSSFGWNTAWYTRNGDSKKHEKADFVFNDFSALTEFLDLKS